MLKQKTYWKCCCLLDPISIWDINMKSVLTAGPLRLKIKRFYLLRAFCLKNFVKFHAKYCEIFLLQLTNWPEGGTCSELMGVSKMKIVYCLGARTFLVNSIWLFLLEFDNCCAQVYVVAWKETSWAHQKHVIAQNGGRCEKTSWRGHQIISNFALEPWIAVKISWTWAFGLSASLAKLSVRVELVLVSKIQLRIFSLKLKACMLHSNSEYRSENTSLNTDPFNNLPLYFTLGLFSWKPQPSSDEN